MQRYSVLETVGDGSFGTVYRARCLRTGDIVAIKHIKTRFPSWNECLGLREVASLTKLRHENIIRLRELIYVKEDGFLNFVFEFADGNLYSLLQGRKALVASADKTSLPPFLRPPNGLLASGLREDEVRVIAAEVLRSLSHMHKHGFFHRDLKPENILITSAVPRRSSSPALTVQELAATHITLNTPPPSASAAATPVASGTPVPADSASEGPRASPVPALSVPGGSGSGAGSGSLVFKLCDFGQARETRSRPPYTAYVSTRWYRAPEVVLGISHYNSPIDLWAAGAVLGELITGRPLFPGTSALNQIYSIAGLVGPLLPGTWQEGFRAAAGQGIRFSGGPGAGGPAGFSLSTSLSYLPSPSAAAAAAGGGAVDFNVGASGGGTAGGSGVYGAGVGGPPPPAALAALLTSAGASGEAVEVVAGLLRWDPASRLNASEALAAPFFRPFVRELEERDREAASSSGSSGRARTSTSAQVAAGAVGGGAGSGGAEGKRLSNAGSGAAAPGSGSVGWSEEEEQWRARDRDHASAPHRAFRPSFAPAGSASSAAAAASSASVATGGLHAGEGAAAEPTVVSARRSEGGASRHPSTASLGADAAAIATAAVAAGGGCGTSRSHSSGGASGPAGAAAAAAAPPSFDLDAELAGLDLMRAEPPLTAGQRADPKAAAAAGGGAGWVPAHGQAAGSALPLQRPPQPRSDPSAATVGAAAGADARGDAAAANSSLSDSRRHAPSDHAASAGSSLASAPPAAAPVGALPAAGAGAGGPARHKRAGSGAGGSSGGGLFSCMTRGAATGTPPGAGWEEGSGDGEGPAGSGSGGFLASLFQGRRGKAGSPVPQHEAAPGAIAPRVHSLTHVVPTTVAASKAGQAPAAVRQQEEPGAAASLRAGAAASGPQTPAARQKLAGSSDVGSASAGSSDAFALSPLLRETEAALAGTGPQPQHMQRASSFMHHHSATTGAGATATAGSGSSAQLADRPIVAAPSRPKPAADPTVDDLLAEIDSA